MSASQVRAYLITKVVMDAPDGLLLDGYEPSFVPGEIVLDPKVIERTETYTDGPVTYRVDLFYLTTGTRTGDEAIVFDERSRVLLNTLRIGAEAEKTLLHVLHAFAEEMRELLDEKKADALISDVDTLETKYAAGIREARLGQ